MAHEQISILCAKLLGQLFADFRTVFAASKKSPPKRAVELECLSAYFSKDNTDCGCWLAWANMAVAAC